jgi:hypothetical protein
MSNITYFPFQGNVDGNQWDAPAIAINNGITIPTSGTELVDPSSWSNMSWMEESSTYQSKGSDRMEYKYMVGYRFHLELNWDYLDLDARNVLIPIINSNSLTSWLRVWPHKSATKVYYDCNIDNHINSNYIANSPIGYGGLSLSLTGRKIMTYIPMFERRWYFTRSSDVTAGNYGSGDEIFFFTRSADVAAGNYSGTDKIGFFNDGGK